MSRIKFAIIEGRLFTELSAHSELDEMIFQLLDNPVCNKLVDCEAVTEAMSATNRVNMEVTDWGMLKIDSTTFPMTVKLWFDMSNGVPRSDDCIVAGDALSGKATAYINQLGDVTFDDVECTIDEPEHQ